SDSLPLTAANLCNRAQAGIRVGNDGFRGEVLALGPVVRTTFGKVPLTFQWQHEFMAHNRPQGDKFWIKSVFRF
ncbi:transporter, partial [Sphingobium sp. DC-2]|uniref:transporter n=1 Tax=Sphingobium sp. DC-2 TaxID=1303256 RepID=UPI0004C3BAC9